MKKEIYGIIGLGKFGSVLAKELIDQGKRVIVSDIDEEAVKELQDRADFAYILDSTHTIALKEAGYANADVVILSIGENLESSILTFMALKEIGVKNIIAKANSSTHGQILSKLGVNKVIYPEKESAKRLAKILITNPNFEIIDLSANTIKVAKVLIDENLAGKTLQSIGQNLKVIAHKQHDAWSIMPNLETTAYLNDILMLLGTQEELNQYEY
ncbi:potassium transporter KtrAB, KtrA subunit [Campylobacter subantarcticus LMG 24377]|uniref:Potassium transporter KtrAB, KtrA subunit n=2 Tax=Campylobacter subantarcticus TaxID=497724 RepID=A0A0A8H7F1_9BACT|nr:TrkA family potassium uptake protein [Campylobacter subantarcticus]EAJ1260767.1 TrkA family potassium uptake protein [Campylobacter lari]AJC90048.1 potassium transporter KtrAB, KtrA subunit [Campylobacter subantarcticus LMG 24374]AJC91714.1 potassium transporter KtrAB, KtrA subunit [Campylobacter subantarcticus LMG 24377]EAL3939001.1 TRK system potassium uptake protein [Campylobacter lari]MPB98838.1 TrkA family potassium uptake protein [Campylobacter subantarcticus]